MINKYEKTIQEIKKESFKIKPVFEYVNLYKKICKLEKKRKFTDKDKVKIAILSGFTVNGLKECLDIFCRIESLKPEIYECPYQQYEQEILDKESRFYCFDPEITFFLLDPKELLKEIYHSSFDLSKKRALEFEKTKITYITNLIKGVFERSNSIIVFANFIAPVETSLGVLENRKLFSLSKIIKKINLELEKYFAENKRVFVFDLDNFASKYGKELVLSPKFYYLGHYFISPDFLPQLAYKLMGYVKALKGKSRKCLVLDLDNVLWGGIVGEDGFEGIQLGPEPPGNTFWEFQKTIKSLHDRGIILAINSNNNQKDALEVIKKHPYMVLRDEYFSAVKINWNDKVSNMKAIIKELNIGFDSLVYIDDDPKKRKMIRDLLPEVRVVELSEDPAFYADNLLSLNDFDILQVTEEDLKRGKMYREQRQRTEFKATAGDLSQFLQDLGVELHFTQVNTFTIPRISQLTQRTNQFNVTTRRYSEKDIEIFATNKTYKVYSAQVKDKFGDYGICGLAIAKSEKKNLIIDTLLLSCRVLGLEVEKALLLQIVNDAFVLGHEAIIGEFIPTEKNLPAADFYKKNQFNLLEKKPDRDIWKLELSKTKFEKPKHIKINLHQGNEKN